ncbi:MAG: hypothetical protein WAU82_12730 [Candidatus Binatus sp.]|uniref:hypothetical protein n=1 Tax=Candidatus Binatus sp. TaxID=2811406 RepID=UPI003BB0624D
MGRAEGAKIQWLFPCLLISFCAIYLIFYPPSYGIEDEGNILQLSYSLSHGTIFPDRAGPYPGPSIDGHRVSKFSAFHAAMIAPLWKIDWRLGFGVAALFFVAGAFIVRNWLTRENLNADWSALYFLLFGSLYYTQTLLAAVPAAVAALFGVSLLLREEPRPMLAGLMFGASVLMHPWMGPFAIVSAMVWLLENWRIDLIKRAGRLFAGAIVPILMLGSYNFATTGSPFRSVYTLLYLSFSGSHFLSYSSFYVASLTIFPLSGWVVFSPKWARGWTLPVTSAAVVLLASLYYYRDGLNLSASAVHSTMALIAGAIPGQRFLIPVSMVACVPAARFLDAQSEKMPSWVSRLARPVALAAFIAGFAVMSTAHSSFLRAHATVQKLLCETIPGNAPVAISDGVLKETAPICQVFESAVLTKDSAEPPAEAFIAWLGAPGQHAPDGWLKKRETKTFQIRSWIWSRDLTIGAPLSDSAQGNGPAG